MTWASARRCRCWRCCWSCGAARRTGNAPAPEPSGGAGVAPRELGGGDRALRTGVEGARCASLGRAERRAQSLRRRTRFGLRPRDHELWIGRPHAPWLHEVRGELAVLDEAQAIRNPDAQADARGEAAARHVKIALTGTPVENRLGDLWSIFDFVNPGLLGSQEGIRRRSPSGSRAASTMRTRRCASSCGRISCGG